MVGTFSLVVLMTVVVPLLLQIPFAIWFAVSGEPIVAGTQRLLDLDDPTPLGLAYLNLVLACAIPVTWFLTRVLHGLRPRWLSSVAGGIRWRWLLVCFGLAVVSLLATLLVSALVPVSAGDAQVSTEVNDFTRTTRDFLLVLVLLTPLQAAGEEYAFLGYLTQAFGGLFRRPWVAVAGPALLFALARRAGPAGVLRPLRVRGRRRGARDRHRRPRGGHRDARAEQLAGVRPGAGVRRHGLDAQPHRWHLVEPPRDARSRSSTSAWPSSWRAGWGSPRRPVRPFWRPPVVAC